MTLIETNVRRQGRRRRTLRGTARYWGRTALIGLIGAGAVLLLALAAAAVTVLGLAIAAAALTLRLMRRRDRAREADAVTIEARRMPDGWAAEPRG